MCRAETEAREDDQSKKPLQAYGAVRIQPKSCRLANVSFAALAKGGYLARQNDL